MLTAATRMIRIAFAAQSIINRFAISAANKTIIQHQLIEAIERRLSDSYGVFVHWGGYESGKSTAAEQAGRKMQQAGKTVIILHGFDFSHIGSTREWLCRSLGIPPGEKISDYFSQQTTIILDHFDCHLKSHPDAFSTLRSLAEESNNDQKFNILVMVSSWENALELKETGAKQLCDPEIGRWTSDQLVALFETIPESIKAEWTGEKKDELMGLCLRSGAPGILFLASENGNWSKAADLHNLEWNNGIRALRGEDMACAKGVFPDKDGIFHWNTAGST